MILFGLCFVALALALVVVASTYFAAEAMRFARTAYAPASRRQEYQVVWACAGVAIAYTAAFSFVLGQIVELLK